MNRTTILFSLFILASSVPAQGMHAKKKPRVSCLEHCAAVGAVMVFSSMCMSVGFGAHNEIVQQVRDERNPCLTVRATNSEFDTFVIKPPLCDSHYNLTDLVPRLNQQIGHVTAVYGQITTCDTLERHKGPIKRITRTCIDKPGKITAKQLVKVPKKQKTD